MPEPKKYKFRLTKKELADSITRNAEVGVVGGMEIVAPSEEYPKQIEYCRMKLRGAGKDDILAEVGMDDQLWRFYERRFRGFILRTMNQKAEELHAENLLTVTQRIQSKLKDVASGKEGADRHDLYDYLSLSHKMVESSKEKKPIGNQAPLIMLIDNRTHEDKLKKVELDGIRTEARFIDVTATTTEVTVNEVDKSVSGGHGLQDVPPVGN